MILTSFGRGIYNLIKSTVNGSFALTSQPYVELNVKRGSQWELFSLFRNVPSNGEKVVLFRTGDKNCIVKNRILQSNKEDAEFYLSTNATITSTGTPYEIINLNEVYQEPLETAYYENPVVSAQGNLKLLDWIPGEQGVSNRSTGGFVTTGLERVLQPNSDYLLVIKNNAEQAADMSLYITFYEGIVNPLGTGDSVNT